jgi:hypothetical protein
MEIFIWNNVEGLTGTYHDSGGLVICAQNIDLARALFLVENPKQTSCEALTIEPDNHLAVKGTPKPFVCIHPDAGCC